MRRQALYSSSTRTTRQNASRQPAAERAPESDLASLPAPRSRVARFRAALSRHGGLWRFLGGAACAALIAGAYLWSHPPPPPLTQKDIDAAVLHTMEHKALPSPAAKAAAIVGPAVVRVRGFGAPPHPATPQRRGGQADGGMPRGQDGNGNRIPENWTEVSVGSGVVVVDDGIILTNLHVVRGAKRVTVTFHDGLESEADVVSVHPENDLAVIKARTIPDDLQAATLGSAERLKPGDQVVAVGFPFGVGPSVSAGVVSGLNREFRSPHGNEVLTQLIQFDAAANPGSSGGPLVTTQGDVVGIVTAIMNPSGNSTFAGIGFAVTIAAAGSAVGVHPF